MGSTYDLNTILFFRTRDIGYTVQFSFDINTKFNNFIFEIFKKSIHGQVNGSVKYYFDVIHDIKLSNIKGSKVVKTVEK